MTLLKKIVKRIVAKILDSIVTNSFFFATLLKKIVKRTVATILDSVETTIKNESKEAVSRQYNFCRNIKSGRLTYELYCDKRQPYRHRNCSDYKTSQLRQVFYVATKFLASSQLKEELLLQQRKSCRDITFIIHIKSNKIFVMTKIISVVTTKT